MVVFVMVFGDLSHHQKMTRLNFALFVLWTVVSLGFCQTDGEPVIEEVTDKDIVKAIVEVCQPRHQKRALLCIKCEIKFSCRFC